MKSKIKILFVRPHNSSFIQKDLELLNKHFDIKEIDFVFSGKTLKTKITNLFNMALGVLWADITFSWFADYHAFWAVRLSKVFRKKSIVVVGGYEVAKVPEIGYGAMLDIRSKGVVRYVLDNADKVLTVDESLKKDAIKNIGVTGENILTIPTGYDYEKYKPKGEKKNLVITVGNISDNVIKRKGFDTFIKAAKYVQNAEFILIGKTLDDSIKSLMDIAPENVEFTGYVSEDELIRYYQKAKVYCQLSIYEGLPNALCEAMLCECVPVGTINCGIPTAIGDAGFYVPYGDPKATAEAINIAMNSNKGKDARERIKNMFSIERREKELVQTIREVLQSE